jgi:hypothetical protein
MTTFLYTGQAAAQGPQSQNKSARHFSARNRRPLSFVARPVRLLPTLGRHSLQKPLESVLSREVHPSALIATAAILVIRFPHARFRASGPR